MEKDLSVEKVDMDEGLIELKISEKYIERLMHKLKAKSIGPTTLSNFILEQLELKDRIDYGYLDQSILPPGSANPLHIISRNRPYERGIRNADFVLFMELMMADRLGHIRNLGVIRKGRLIDAYTISFYANAGFRELIDMANEHIKTEKLPNLILPHQLIGILDDFKDKYNLI